MDNKIILKPGREKSVLARHPWIFSGAIQEVYGEPELGSTVQVLDSHGNNLGLAAYSPISSIRARMWGLKVKEVNGDLLKDRILRSVDMRRDLVSATETNSKRLIYAESDGLPGLIVDKYGDYLSVQILSAGPEYWRGTIIEILNSELEPFAIIERSDVDVRELEGLHPRSGLVHGEKIPETFLLIENDKKFQVDLTKGQKTGFYLDQRSNRKTLSSYANKKEILNCFCYTGGFSVYALACGASFVTSIDSSADAINLAKNNIEINKLSLDKTHWIVGDVFHELRRFRDEGRSFDMIIMDPPKFAPTTAQVERAARGYKDINLLAFKLLRPNGILATFSCSGGVSVELFQKIVAGAALDAGVDAQILRTLTQGLDHPVALNFPESAYLKGLICRKVQ